MLLNNRMHSRRRNQWMALPALLLAMAAVQNAPVRADPFMPGIADQKKLGAQEGQQIEQKYRSIAGPPLERVQRVGQRLVNALPSQDKGKWDYRFHVLDSKEINAFAIPGGNMYVFTGLLSRIKSDDELAAVMGHEMTHVRKQHWARMQAAASKRQLGLGILLGAAHAGRGVDTVVGLGNQLLNLRYSRKDEDEADAGGLYNMMAAGYNPQGMISLFNTLQQAAGNGSAPALLQDHPLTKDRIHKTEERIAVLRANGRY